MIDEKQCHWRARKAFMRYCQTMWRSDLSHDMNRIQHASLEEFVKKRMESISNGVFSQNVITLHLASVTFYFITAFDSRYFGSRIDTNLMEKFQLFITDCRCSKVVEQKSLLSVITIIQCIDCLLVNNIIEQAILQKRS